ncbi:MFS transporter [Psychrosphaera ytuae]|uniref:MFS transporter n=1 Tax=Psychrosphaera ytuae TaxID=2820710 RepID=A0A975D9E1_9GAMM|nr:glycoside-pentoside-hexuronide (GPH):cation symporter [Psychrosphaera ytuae]QTH62763.1 MFS transporter [Psychrosphaera ytuae]
MLSIREKVAYGLGDTASNIIFQTVMMFLLVYYTDVVGLSPAETGTMFLLVRVIDAITDPLMGSMADRTRSKWGRYRPYLLWLALPFGIISVLAFTSFEAMGDYKYAYAFLTYTMLMLIYTAINIPYSALASALTDDPKQRVSVQSYRFVFGMLGGLLIAAGTLPLVEYFGEGDKAKGYMLTMAVMGGLGVGLFLLCFAGTKERVQYPSTVKTPFKESLKSLFNNDQWRVLAAVGVFLLSGQVLRASLAVYYVTHYLQRPDLVTTFITLGMIASIIGCSLSAKLAKRICKVKAYMYLQLLAAGICASSYLISPSELTIAFSAYILWNFVLQMATPLLWAKMADTADYGLWKTQNQMTGLVYSSVVFFIKLGVAIGGALAGWLLAFYDYQADQVQSVYTQQGILLCFSLFPAIGSVCAAFVMRWYNLTDDKVALIHAELKQQQAIEER